MTWSVGIQSIIVCAFLLQLAAGEDSVPPPNCLKDGTRCSSSSQCCPDSSCRSDSKYSSKKSCKSSISTAEIIIIVCSVVGFLLIVSVVALVCRRRQARMRERQSRSNPNEPDSHDVEASHAPDNETGHDVVKPSPDPDH